MNKIKLNIVVFIGLLLPLHLIGQDNFNVGIFMSGGRTFHHTDISDLHQKLRFKENFESGNGNIVNFGLFAIQKIDDKIDMSLRLGLNSYNVLFTKKSETEIFANNSVVRGEFEKRFKVNISEVSVSPLIIYKVNKFGLLAGINLSIVNNALFETYETIESIYSDAQFLNQENEPSGSNIRMHLSGELPNSSDISVNLQFGVNYSVKLSPNLHFIPEISYSHGLISPINNYDWSYRHINMGFGIKYSPTFSTREVIDAPLVSISLFPIDSNYNNKNSFEYIKSVETKVIPLLNSIYFDKDSTEIPARYNIIESIDTKDYYIKSGGKNILSTYYDVLNIIGRRLINSNTSKIRLRSVVFEDNVADLNFYLKRAENIRDYFKQIWNIDSSRIIIELVKIDMNDYQFEKYQNEPNSYNNIVQENNRVDIIPDNMEIIAPVITYDTTNTLLTNNLSLMTFVSKQNNINAWKFEIDVNNERMYALSGKDAIPQEAKIPVPDNFTEKLPATITYNLKLKTDNNNFSFNGEVEFGGQEFLNKSINYYLIWKDYDKIYADNFGDEIAELINLSVTDDTKIILNAYTDNTGFESTNRIRSEARAISFSKLLLGNTTQLNIMDSGKSLFGNTYPEERVYNRCLEIILKRD